MASEKGAARGRTTHKPKKRTTTTGIVRLTVDEVGVLPEPLDSTNAASRQLAVELVRCIGECELNTIAALRVAVGVPDEGPIFVAEADRERGFQLGELHELLMKFAQGPSGLGEDGLHVGSASLLLWRVWRRGDEPLKFVALAERAASLRRQALTNATHPIDAPRVAPEANHEPETKQTLDQLQSLLETVRSQAHGNAAFATETAVLLEKTLEELRVLAVEPRPFNQEQIEIDAEPHRPLMSARETIERLQKFRDRDSIQTFLDRFVVGRTWETLQDNQVFTNGLNDHLRPLDLRVACVVDGKPSLLRCYPTTSAHEGAYYFDHSKSRHGGSPIIPKEMKVVEASPDPRRTTSKIPTTEA